MEICALAGLKLDPWQEFALRESMGERPDGKWAALEVGIEVARQNGKGAFLEARQLTGLFLLEERLQIHTAHQFDTSLEAFGRLLELIEATPDFDREVLRVVKSHGEEGIELRGKRRIRFRTRTGGGGRGFSGDVLYLDEAMIISEAMHGALFPVLSARPNPQIIYTGSAVDQLEHEHGVVFARIRERGLKGGDPSLAWFGWGHCPSGPDDDSVLPDTEEARELLDDRDVWSASNPGLGIRISPEFIEAERRSMSSRNFAVERLGIGDWPDTAETDEEELFDLQDWDGIRDREAKVQDPVTFAVDVSPDRSSASIGVGDSAERVELIERNRGARWVIARVAELVEDHGSEKVVLDGRGPAAAFQDEMEELLGFEVTVTSTADYTQACSGFFDAVKERTLRHGGQPELDAAVKGAKTRPLGEAWAFSRKKSDIDITPLVACTLARWGAIQEEDSVYEDRGVVVLK
ncbi:MAG TPA: hypothetical protein VFN92_13400 [Solirubrobacterales bacterium]|nr:hypothetical protein [Solirubrobacterales bacterium]